MESPDKTTAELLDKLDTVIGLLAHQVAHQNGTLETKALALSAAGLKPALIAKICGTTPATISTRLTEAKKKGKRKASKKK